MTPYGTIYLATCVPTGKQYVGQTTRGVDYRWAQHVGDAARGKRNGCRYLVNAIRKYGADAFTIETLCECESAAQLDAQEDWHIAHLGTLAPRGYNLKSGGQFGARLSADSRAKHAASAKRLAADPEWRTKMVAAGKRRAADPEYRAKMKRVYADPEWRAKQSAMLKRFTADPQWRAKNAAAAKRRSADPEWRAKMVATMKRITADPQWRAKNAATMKRITADPQWRAKNAAAMKRSGAARRAKSAAAKERAASVERILAGSIFG